MVGRVNNINRRSVLINPGLAPGVGSRSRSFGWMNPGLPPGVSRTTAHARNPVGVSPVLTADVFSDTPEIPFADGGRVEPASPADGTGDPIICAIRRPTLREPHKVTQRTVRSKAGEDVYVIGQDGALEDTYTSGPFCVSDRRLEILHRGLIHTPYPAPRVPSDVSVQLVGMVRCHRSRPQSN